MEEFKLSNEACIHLFAALDCNCNFDVYNDFTISGLLLLLRDVLSEKELRILYMRVAERKSLGECGQALSLSRERVRQIEKEIYHHLNTFKGIDEYKVTSNRDLIEIKKKQEQQEADNRRLLEQIITAREVLKTEKDVVAPDPAEMILLGNIHLSLRSYNALRRDGSYTMKDVITKYLTVESFSHIKNIGVKSAAEIIAKVHEYGYKMAWEK